MKALPNILNKFTPSVKAGTPLFPSVPKYAAFQFRVVATHFDEENQRIHVALRVNREATAPALKEFINKESPSANLATEVFDLKAEDKKVEFDRMMDSMVTQAKEKIG